MKRYIIIIIISLLAGFSLGLFVFQLIVPNEKEVVFKEEALVMADKTTPQVAVIEGENDMPPLDDDKWLTVDSNINRPEWWSHPDNYIISRFKVYRNKRYLLDIWDQEQKIGTVDVSSYMYDDPTYKIWSMFTTPKDPDTKHSETRIYFLDAAGCGGCAWASLYYIAIDMRTKEVKLKTIPDDKNSLLFKDPNPGKLGSRTPYFHTSVSPSGKLVAFLPDWDDESVWVHDLLTNTEEKIFDLPTGQTVLNKYPSMIRDMSYVSWSPNIYANQPDLLFIKPQFTPPAQVYKWSKTLGIMESQGEFNP